MWRAKPLLFWAAQKEGRDRFRIGAKRLSAALRLTSFVVSSCDFVDPSNDQKNKNDRRIHTNQHEPKSFRLERDVTFSQSRSERNDCLAR